MVNKKVNKTAVLFIESLFAESCKKMGLTEDFEVHKLTGDASSRRYYRVFSDSRSFIACLNEPGDTLDNFYDMQSVLSNEKIKVPEIFDYDKDKGYLLQEDLGDKTLLKKLSLLKKRDDEFLIYKDVLSDLISLQNIDGTKYTTSCFASLSFDMPKLFQEINFTIEYLLQGFLGASLSEHDLKKIRDQFKRICSPLVTHKPVLTHRDFHSRNIMCMKGKLYMIDFQDARMGIPQYDLVSMLEDCYYKIADENKDKLKTFFWEEHIKKNALQSSYDEYLELYDFMTIQRTFKAMGSFAYIYKTRKDERYLKYIGYTFENLRVVLNKYPALSSLRLLLSKYYYDN